MIYHSWKVSSACGCGLVPSGDLSISTESVSFTSNVIFTKHNTNTAPSKPYYTIINLANNHQTSTVAAERGWNPTVYRIIPYQCSNLNFFIGSVRQPLWINTVIYSNKSCVCVLILIFHWHVYINISLWILNSIFIMLPFARLLGSNTYFVHEICVFQCIIAKLLQHCVSFDNVVCDSWIQDGVMTWKRFPRYSTFVRGIHRGLMESFH